MNTDKETRDEHDDAQKSNVKSNVNVTVSCIYDEHYDHYPA